MSLLESKLNSIAAIAVDAALNSARLDYVNQTFYSKSDAASALSTKQQNIILAPATITLGQSADYTYFVDTNSYSYPLFASQDIVWRKNANNISLSISDDFKNAYLSTAAAATLYARADEISTFETTVSLLNNVYQTKVDMGSYITSGSLTAYQTVANMSSYVTSSQVTDKVNTATLSSTLDLYATKDLASDIFQDKAGMGDYQTVANMISYITGGSIANTLSSYLTSSGATSLYQLRGNYLTDTSVFQLSGNYLTTFTPLSGTYLSIIDAGNTYQSINNMTNYPTLGTTLLSNYNTQTTTAGILTNYPTLGTTLLNNYNTQTTTNSILSNYITSGSLAAYQTILNMATYVTSGSLTAYQPVANMSSYVTSGSLVAYAPINNPTFTGNVTASSISIGGVDTSSLYQPKYQIAGYVNSTGTVGGNYGTKTFTVNKTGTGAYTITFSSSIGSTSYAVIGGIRNGTGSISYNGTAATAVNVQTYNLAGTQTDLTFNFYILQ